MSGAYDDRHDAGWGEDPPPQPTDGLSAALAGFWRRFLGAFIDGILLSIVAAVLGFGTVSTGEGGVQTAGSGIQTLLNLAYFTYMHGSAAGQSIGNRLVSIRVADIDTGQPLTWSRALVRALMSIVSAIPLGLGYFWMLWDDKNQTWHDKVAKSVVVGTDQSPAPGPFGRPA